MKKFVLIIPIVLFTFFNAGATEGCLVDGSNELFITQTNKEGIYSNNGSINSGPGCNWLLVSHISPCNGYNGPGVRGEYMLECPVDDYVLGLFIFTGALGVFFLGRKNEL